MTDVSVSDSSVCIIPQVPGFAWGEWQAVQAALANGVRLDFAQPWFGEPEADFKPGHVWLGINDEQLVAYSVFQDDQPHNRATTWNEATWTLGDVIELFFQADGRPGYYEFHVTPENQRVQLFFPSSAAFREHRGHRHWAIGESKFESITRINPERTVWECVMRVPLALVLDEPRTDGSRRFRVSFSRYDFQPGRSKPVTSATTPLSRPDFHHIPQWSWAEAAKG